MKSQFKMTILRDKRFNFTSYFNTPLLKTENYNDDYDDDFVEDDEYDNIRVYYFIFKNLKIFQN